jgi:L,D-peptidoglycan transpeptidase YkuD (ErfK/YbiS/YcfS/YnhG family)
MLIRLKNKDTLKIDEFSFKCCIGKKGLKAEKVEGDLATPKGTYLLKKLYYRSDKFKKIETLIPKTRIKKNMGWCNDPKHRFYNSLIKISKKVKHEKMYRKDRKYDLVIVIDYNLKKPIPFKGSAIFIHLTQNYKPTAGCIALSKNDMLVLLKIINKKTKINIC